MEQRKERMAIWMAIIYVTFFVGVDLAEFIITWLGLVKLGGILSMVLSFVAGFINWIWLLILGIPGLSNPRQFAVRLSTFVIEIIPFLDAIPFISWAWTIGAIVTVIITRSEDKGGIIGGVSKMIPGK